jgi:anti-sigma factor RsiW
MSCLKISDIYDYLEGILSSERSEDLEKHLVHCLRCRRAVEDRKLIAGAASGLAPLAVPDDFTDRIMARVAPVKVKNGVWLIVLASASSLLALTAMILIASGNSVLSIISSASHSLWEYAKSGAVLTARVMTFLSLTAKTVQSLLGSAAKGLSLANSLFSPGLQVVLGLMMVLIISLALAARKKISMGD